VAKHTVLKLLKDMGCACSAYHDAHVRNIRVRRVQCDEAWSFVYAKQKNVTAEQMAAGAGDCWTWVAEDADTKLVACRRVTITRLLASKLSWLLAAKSCSPSNSSPI
jgi:hypothetical protein